MQKDIKQYITKVDEGYELEIALNEKWRLRCYRHFYVC